MEFSDIELKHSDTKSSDAPIYVNTTLSTESVGHTTTPKSGNTGENEGLYEKLRFGCKQNETDRIQNASKSLRWEDIPNRIKYAIYAIIAVIVVLFVVDIVVIVLIALPKNKVDGNWIQWSPWSNCDVTCNNGTQTRMRFCINPAPSNGGIDCSGKSVDTKQCENDGCSVDGNWIQWSPWSNCDATCNNGTQTRMRFCINPAPSNGGIDCSGKSVDTKLCKNDGCSVDGNWIQWSPWSNCDVTCNNGTQTRMRFCINPAPSNGGIDCSGKSVDTKQCENDGCSSHDGWSQWSPWDSCSVSCGIGKESRDRTCSIPYPIRNGDDCLGESSEDRICVQGTCAEHHTNENYDKVQKIIKQETQILHDASGTSPKRFKAFHDDLVKKNKKSNTEGTTRNSTKWAVNILKDGGWSNWGSWGSCSDSCGGGVRSRIRTCTNPKPSLLGRYCDGSPEQVTSCNKHTCLDGGWSNWGSWGSCSDSCEGGVRSRLRTCTNPRPSLFGRYCDGSPEQVMICNKQACPVNGNWIHWSSWSHCDVTCNNGTQTRRRFCINPAPSNGGIDCPGKSIDTKPCENDGCSDGGWSSWGSWGSCSDSCGGGVRSRLRTCTNPRPSLLGRYCDGSPEQVMPCNKYTCSDGGWSSWGSWGSCSDSCGGGVRSRLRTCTNPRPALLGKYCDGSPEEVMPCNKQTCPDHMVAFTAYGSTSGTSYAPIIFPSTLLNIGGGYSTSTGRFTCKIPGIYNFAVTLTKKREDIDHVSAYLRVNGLNKLQLNSDPSDNDNIDFGSYSLSVTGNFHLNKNDYVVVYGVPSYFYNDYKTSFTGVLVIPDG